MKQEFIHDPYLKLYLRLWKRDAANGQSFMSDDAYGHLATVTGATWGIQGRTFDGVDDKIVVSGLTLSVTAFTVSVWVYLDPAAAALNGKVAYLVCSGNYTIDGFAIFWDDRAGIATNTIGFNFRGTSGTYSSCYAPDNTCSTAGWYLITARYDKNEGGTTEHQLSVNGAVVKSADFSEQLKAITGSFTLGLKANDGTNDFGGIISEVIYRSRKITEIEDQRNYLNIK